MATLDELLDEIFEGKKPAFYREFEGWARDSRRFRAFAAEYRVKIRAKLKRVHDQGGMEDLRAELAAAALLLREERFTLEYEKYAASKGRGPDFTVTFKTHTPFNIEVRRIRGVELEGSDLEAHPGKLIEVLCDKVGQMPPGIVNLLWLAAEREIPEAEVTGAAAILRQLAERKVEEFFARRGYQSAAAFLRQYQQLSGIVMIGSGENVVWLNSLARHRPPPDVITAIRRLKAS